MIFIIVGVIIFLICLSASRSAEKSRSSKAEEKYGSANHELKNDVVKGVIRIGMSEENVIDAWGMPSRRTTRMLKTKSKSTLHFGTRKRVHFDNGRVVGWDLPT